MPYKISKQQLEILGQSIADKASNYLGLLDMPLSPQLKIEGATQGLQENRDAARTLIIEITGENPWADEL